MPQAPQTPCNNPGCGNLTNSRYCEQHKQDKTNYRHTKTSTQRGYGYAWQKLRKVIFRRDSMLCQLCLKAGRTTQADVVDHIQPKAKGGTDSMDNLQSLCTKCHNTKTAKEDSK